MRFLNLFNDLTLWISVILNIVLIAKGATTYFARKRYIKNVLGFSREPVQISQCIFNLQMRSGSWNNFVTYASVTATNNIVNLLCSVNQEFYLVEQINDAKNEINIGGFTANKKTNAYLTKYFPGFKFQESREREQFHQKDDFDMKIYEFTDSGQKGFKVGNLFLDVTDRIMDYAFLIKLVKSDFKDDNEKTVHIVFGARDGGTEKATEYLLTHYKQIYQKYGKEHYFFALEVQQGEINYNRGIIDLTDQMFG